jgi:hypothetical protein
MPVHGREPSEMFAPKVQDLQRRLHNLSYDINTFIYEMVGFSGILRGSVCGNLTTPKPGQYFQCQQG